MDKNIIILAAVTLLAIFLYGQIDYEVEPYSGMDLKYYRQMAAASPHIARGLPRPFSYRLLGPWLAGLAGEGSTAGFLALTVFSSLALVIIMYKVLLSMKISRAASLIAVLAFIMNKHLFGIGNWDFFQVKDTLSLAIMAASLLAMYRGRYILLGILLAAGSATGELALLMIPVLAVYLLERKRARSDMLKALACCLPAVAVFALIRLLVPVSGGMGLMEAGLHYGRKLKYPAVWFHLLANPFVPLTLIPFVTLSRTIRFARSNLHLAAMFLLVLASASFGSNNERLMAPAIPAFYALIAFLLDSPGGRPVFVRVVVVLAVILASTHHSIARFPLPSRTLTIILALAGLTSATLVFLYSVNKKGSVVEPAG